MTVCSKQGHRGCAAKRASLASWNLRLERFGLEFRSFCAVLNVLTLVCVHTESLFKTEL